MGWFCSGSEEVEESVEEAVSDELVDCASGKCPRRFLIIYGDPGLEHHNLGRLPELAAKTHKKEIEANSFSGVPTFNPSVDIINVVHSTDARAFANEIKNSTITIGYLSYFGHSWANDDGKWGYLFVGEENAPETNFGTDRGDPNDVVVTELSKSSFYNDAQIRIFGCRGGYGSYSVTQQMADHLGLNAYGYSNSGGSLFTNDKNLGHGGRSVTQEDIDASISGAKDVWLIPINGTPTFKEF